MLSAPELRRRTLASTFCVLLVCSSTTAQAVRSPRSQPDIPPTGARQIARQVLPSVVLITMDGGCFGSGFFITSELIATNKHVLQCGWRGMISLIGNRHAFPIIASWSDPQHDLALIRIAKSQGRPLLLSPRGWPAVGDDVYVAGNPEGLEGTFSKGIISGLRRNEGLIQFDAPVSPGSSGGPGVDERGQVVGVTMSSVQGGQNLNFAVSAQYLRALLERTRRGAPDNTKEASSSRRQPMPAPLAVPTNPVNRARGAWDANPDWGRYVSDIIGDTVVKNELKALIDSGLSVNAKDRIGRSAVHVATTLGQVELTRYLLARGANPNGTDAAGRTPLMLTVSLGGINWFNAMTSPWERFWTEPLCSPEGGRIATQKSGRELTRWFAVWQAERLMVIFLLGAGADVNAVDKEGRTVLDHAALGGLTDFDELIRRTGRLRNKSECALKLTDSPALHGFKLGMSLREVTARFRRFTMPETDPCGRLNLDFNEEWDTLRNLALKPEELAGVRRIRLTFFDERLVYIRVTYSDEGAVANPQEFRATLSKSLSLPEKWRETGVGDNWDHAQAIGCDGFKIMAGYLVGPYVELHDVKALRALFERKADAEVKRKRSRSSTGENSNLDVGRMLDE